MRFCDDHHSSILGSRDMQFNMLAVVLLHGQERWGIPLTHFFLRRTAFTTFFFKFPLNCNTNYDGTSFKTKCKSCNNSSKEFILRSSYRVSPLLRNVILLIFNDYTPLLVR